VTGTSATVQEAGRKLGRPRSPEADAAILCAAIELFADTGYEGLTIEAVAARAGVSKATVYRRYPGKLELVVAACRGYSDVGRVPPDTGTLRGDLLALVEELIATLTTSPVGRVIPMLVADSARVPELAVELQHIVHETRGRYYVVLERATAKGELRAVDAELVIDALVGPVFYRFLVSGAPLDRPIVRSLVDSVVRSFGPGSP
jgi:AcrR family transcriptional regulator